MKRNVNFSRLEDPSWFLLWFSGSWTVESQWWEAIKKKKGSPSGFYSRVQVNSCYSGTLSFLAVLPSLGVRRVSPRPRRELGGSRLCFLNKNAAVNGSEPAESRRIKVGSLRGGQKALGWAATRYTNSTIQADTNNKMASTLKSLFVSMVRYTAFKTQV